jgi:hypothetical protein
VRSVGVVRDPPGRDNDARFAECCELLGVQQLVPALAV